MSYDKITIVINTFKSEDKIHRCLNSIDPSVKIIIVENSIFSVIIISCRNYCNKNENT